MSARKTVRAAADELRREYRFDYRRSRSNRFAGLVKEGSIAVMLEPDVASVFRSSKDVNALLRSVISALPSKRKKDGKRTGFQRESRDGPKGTTPDKHGGSGTGSTGRLGRWSRTLDSIFPNSLLPIVLTYRNRTIKRSPADSEQE
jgi:hypothetical protein